jgi:hypothetical protein
MKLRALVQLSRTAVLMVSAIVAVGLFYGCSPRDTVPGQKVVYGKFNADPLTEAELRKFASSVRRVDGEAEAHYRLALHFQENYRHKLAIDELRQVLQRNPAHVKAYNALGVSYDNLGDHEAAIESYQIALKIDSNLDYVYNNLGYSYLLNGQVSEALSAFQKAIAINANEKRYRNNLGLAYVKQGRYQQAYEQFLALDTVAGAEKTFSKVMQELGKGSQTENVLLAVKSAPASMAKVKDPTPIMPDLAQREEPKAGNDPVARFQTVTGSMSQPNGSDASGSAAHADQASEIPPQVVQAASPDKSELVPASADSEVVKKAAVAGSNIMQPAVLSEPQPVPRSPAEVQAPQKKIAEPVFLIPPPPAGEESLYEVKVTVTPVAPTVPEPVKLYPIASVALAKSTEAPRKKELISSPPANPVQKEVREVGTSEVELVGKVESQEQQEERVLVAASSTRAAGWQNAPEPGRDAEKGLIEVEVANGNGVKGSAGKVAAQLRRSGFNIVRVMDAQSHDHFSTKVFYYGNINEVRRLLSALPEIAADAELYEMENMGRHIRILIGKDLISKNKNLRWNS